MNKLVTLLIALISITINAQYETINFRKDNSRAKGKIVFINQNYLGFQASKAANNTIKTNKGNLTFKKGKKDNLFLIPRNEIHSVNSENDFKEFLISSNSQMDFLKDRIAYDERNIYKFRKLQLTAIGMSIIGTAISIGGTAISFNNNSASSNPYTFTIIGSVFYGAAFGFSLASFSKLKFEKKYNSIDDKNGYYFSSNYYKPYQEEKIPKEEKLEDISVLKNGFSDYSLGVKLKKGTKILFSLDGKYYKGVVKYREGASYEKVNVYNIEVYDIINKKWNFQNNGNITILNSLVIGYKF